MVSFFQGTDDRRMSQIECVTEIVGIVGITRIDMRETTNIVMVGNVTLVLEKH